MPRRVKSLLDRLMSLFDQCFRESYQTCLIRGHDEPIYYPADEGCDYHRVVFAHGYFTSALHEIAHWCIAGDERRQKVDYGYWYVADGRNAEQQKVFESVEIKPQALEWMFSKACGIKFSISADNLNGKPTNMQPFKCSVYEQVIRYCKQGLPERAAFFHDSLAKEFNDNYCLSADIFSVSEL